MRLAALRIPKAAAWIAGRKTLWADLEAQVAEGDRIIWTHCASAGELEQGKPILEALRSAYPGHRIAVSFFSPSGHGVGKRYAAADIVTYLPLDTQANARRFVRTIRPQLVVFIKYDYWYHHLKAVRDAGIPLLLASALYREGQVFFKPYGGFHRRMLHLFTRIFVQDEESLHRLRGIGVTNAQVSGDTRFDRVATIVGKAGHVEGIDDFLQARPAIVAGSTWAEDEALLVSVAAADGFPYCLVIAPHEINARNIGRLVSAFGSRAVTYSEIQNGLKPGPQHTVLLVDNIGMLSRLYQYGSIAYIGGGFNKSGIHNTLEAAAWGRPVIFGPHYEKFREARGLIETRAAMSVSDVAGLAAAIDAFSDPERLRESSAAARGYVACNGGATRTILGFIQEKRLLTTP
ncbi:MAG: 3-deoxy-D-manno-octulosonic acid transferase [Flaviaesturariibacter sp.]|nr:3-deoxy-D-manno-octulosonic acid transferase [Flaviaesturariibacter sp.]